jgi:hypothetical protein
MELYILYLRHLSSGFRMKKCIGKKIITVILRRFLDNLVGSKMDIHPMDGFQIQINILGSEESPSPWKFT